MSNKYSYSMPEQADSNSKYYTDPKYTGIQNDEPNTLSDSLKKTTSTVIDASYKSAGIGGYKNILQNFLSKLDRHGTAMVPLNAMNYGYTFITRPRLNMTTGNLLQHPVMNTLRSDDPNSVGFMIRCLLDTRLSNGWPIRIAGTVNNDEIRRFSTDIVERSGLVDRFNPFFTPLCNGLKGVSGWPDINLETETSEGDFHSGDFTYAKGSDMNNRTTEFSLEFRDVQGSIILSIFHYWCLAIALQAKGVIMAYPDDIYEQRLNYTVSIYRFVTDVTRRHILWWSKATGCFPKSVPVGALFNLNRDEVTLSSAMNFSIPFTVNDVKYQDPGILFDFDTLVKRYCPDINKWKVLPDNEVNQTLQSGYNFAGLPTLQASSIGWDLVWRTNPDYYDSSSPTAQLSK